MAELLVDIFRAIIKLLSFFANLYLSFLLFKAVVSFVPDREIEFIILCEKIDPILRVSQIDRIVRENVTNILHKFGQHLINL